MNTVQANILNSITLIFIGLWGYFEKYPEAPTALIPVFFGVSLLLCSKGLRNENKTVAHIAVILTFIILAALLGMRLPKSLDEGGVGLYRVLGMTITSLFAMIIFIRSFIRNRK